MRALLAPSLIFLFLFEILVTFLGIANGLFNCNYLAVDSDFRCAGTFFTYTFSNSSLTQPYPTIAPILFFFLFLLAFLVPASTLILIFVKSKTLLVLKLILYGVLLLLSIFYANITNRLPKERLHCDFLSCETFTQTQNKFAQLKNLKIYQPTFLPDSIKNQQKINRGGYPYLVTYGNNFSFSEETVIKLEDCTIEKDRVILGGRCEVISSGDFEARLIYKEINGVQSNFLKFNIVNTTIVINSRDASITKDDLVKIAKSFE